MSSVCSMGSDGQRSGDSESWRKVTLSVIFRIKRHEERYFSLVETLSMTSLADYLDDLQP